MATRKPGRPSKYKDEFPEQARKLCLLGATDKELASFFEVAVSTISEWKLSFPEFSEALKAGKQLADATIADSLYQRAKGYSHREDDIRVVSGAIVITPTIKNYPPDSTALIFWLKNRRPDLWRDKREEEGGGEDAAALLGDLIRKMPS